MWIPTHVGKVAAGRPAAHTHVRAAGSSETLRHLFAGAASPCRPSARPGLFPRPWRDIETRMSRCPPQPATRGGNDAVFKRTVNY
jgi:hypothetical protein